MEAPTAELDFTMEQIRGHQGPGVKRIVFSEADIRAIPQQTAMQILIAIHRLAETGAGRVKTGSRAAGVLKSVCALGHFRVRFTEESGQEESGESGDAGQEREN